MTAQQLRLGVLGAQISVAAPRELAPTLSAQWAHCRAGGPAHEAEHTLDLIGRGGTRDALEYELSRAVTLIGIKHQRGRSLMLHAACVVDPVTGRAAVLVGPSGMGKTTAAARLCQSGFTYVTDEAVALDETGRALLYPKPLSVVRDPARPTDKRQHAPEELGMRVADREPVVTALLLLCRSEQHEEAVLEPVGLLDAIVEIVPQTSALPALDRPLGRLLDLVQACGGVRRLRYRDIDSVVDLVRAVVSTTQPQEAAAAVVHRPPQDARADPSEPVTRWPAPHVGPQTAVGRAPFTEALESDGEVLVLAGVSTVRLDGIGTTVWLACARPRLVSELVSHCVDVHGDVADADRLVAAAVSTLVSHGLLRIEARA